MLCILTDIDIDGFESDLIRENSDQDHNGLSSSNSSR